MIPRGEVATMDSARFLFYLAVTSPTADVQENWSNSSTKIGTIFPEFAHLWVRCRTIIWCMVNSTLSWCAKHNVHVTFQFEIFWHRSKNSVYFQVGIGSSFFRLIIWLSSPIIVSLRAINVFIYCDLRALNSGIQ